MKAVILFISFAVFSISAAAQVYTWKDANGQVHFSDKAPADKQVQTLDLPVAAPAPDVPDVGDAERLARQQRLVKALEEERLEKERIKAEAQAEAEKKAAYCERFKNRLARMDSASLLYSENKDGTVKYWEDKDADRFRKEQKARYQQECGQDS